MMARYVSVNCSSVLSVDVRKRSSAQIETAETGPRVDRSQV
jgi:hypothetical protein